MRATRLAIVVLAALDVSAIGSWAACNLIPAPKDQLLSASNPNAEAVALKVALLVDEQRFGTATPYKGALGRIDRVYLTPLRKDPVRVVFDGQCVGGGTAPLVVRGTSGLVAATILTAATGAPPAVLLATGEGVSCDALVAEKAASRYTPQCVSGDIRRLDDTASSFAIAFPKAPAAENVRQARVAVFHATSPAAAATILDRVATTGCERLCADAAVAPDLGACIDTVYAPVGLAAAQILYAPDLVKCGLLEVPTPIPWNGFADLCQAGPDSSGLPACQNGANALSMWEDGCHGVYVPFDWTNIRHDPSTPTPVDRVVRGQSAVSRRAKFEGGRVWIPGREYVGTLLEGDLSSGVGGTFASDPRKAAIDIWYPTKEEFGLQGVVDKDKSIVHVVPRLAASYLCDQRTPPASDEACMRVATQPSLDVTRCACTDRYPADCTCTALSQGRFFQCAASKMPCTRHAHCNAGDTCSARPHCQKAGDVWDPAQLPASGAECWTDEDCKSDSVRPQCGYLLFDVREKREQNTSVMKLDKTLPSTGPRKQRGACKATSGAMRKACSNGSGGSAPPVCTTAEGDCVGYVLEALGKKN